MKRNHSKFTEADVKAATARLDRLDDRVRKVIARNKPLQLDTSPRKNTPINTPRRIIQQKVQRQASDYTARPVVATGQLEGSEMRLPDYEPPACREERREFDYTRDVIFAQFNS